MDKKYGLIGPMIDFYIYTALTTQIQTENQAVPESLRKIATLFEQRCFQTLLGGWFWEEETGFQSSPPEHPRYAL